MIFQTSKFRMTLIYLHKFLRTLRRHGFVTTLIWKVDNLACNCMLRTLFVQYCVSIKLGGRSQYQRGLKHELSSLSRTLGSWVRISVMAWMFGVCIGLFCVRVVLCLGRGFATGCTLVQGVLLSVKMITEMNKRPGP
jgi:hypothetical protein